jgi:hypothetical protein
MTEWVILDFTERDSSPIQDWLNDKRAVPVKAKAKIQRILLQLAGTVLWTRPLASNLDGFPGIVEIRILWMNTQYRLLGYRGPGERRFTLLFPATEKNVQFVPPNAPLIASNRMAVIEADRSRVREHRFG